MAEPRSAGSGGRRPTLARRTCLRRPRAPRDGDAADPQPAMTLPIAFADIEAAAARLRGVAHRTPVATSRTADELTGARLFFKCENLQRMGAFKFRGAYNALAQFTPQQRRRGVIAYSSGNHAQAIALAARLLGMPAAIVMPADAPPLKIAATRGYGAEVILYDRYTQDREALGRQLAAERGMTLIPPYDHPQVMAGQGTAALELIEDAGPLDLLLVCVGGGGLISGCATAARHLLPACRVIGVEPEAGNDVQRSLREGRIVHIDVPKTIADGAQTQHAGQLTFPVIQALVDDILTVSDAQLVRTMRFFMERMKLVVEPTGCLAAAAALEAVLPVRGQRVGVIVSGGNIDAERYARLLLGEVAGSAGA
jgi:threonine dehydratase